MKQDKGKYYLRTLVVEGSALFPVSMLYRECAIPASIEDAETIERALLGQRLHKIRRVKLTCFREDTKGKPSSGWENCGWKIVEDEAL